VIESGRKNGLSYMIVGIAVEQIIYKGNAVPFEFSPAKSNAGGFSGIIEATFWRVMQIENSNETKKQKMDDDEDNSGIEYVPDGFNYC
jgi:tRNA A37 threonylcarbamoyltransferase TsaD